MQFNNWCIYTFRGFYTRKRQCVHLHITSFIKKGIKILTFGNLTVTTTYIGLNDFNH